MSVMVIREVLWIMCLAALIASVVTDIKDRIIPNELSATIALAGLFIGLLVRPEQAAVSLGAGALVFGALAVLHRHGALGGGDVKLIAAVTLLVPPSSIVELLTRIALAGGVLSGVYLAASYVVRPAPCEGVHADAVNRLADWTRVESIRIASRKETPYAVAIAAGVIWYFAKESAPCSFAMSCLF